MYYSLITCSSNQAISHRRKIIISQGIYCEKCSHINTISYLRILGITLFQHIISNLTTKISMGTQYFFCNRSTKCRINPTHKHRRFTKRTVHPLAKRGLRTRKGIPNPQTYWKRSAIIAATKQRTIRSSCQCGL